MPTLVGRSTSLRRPRPPAGYSLWLKADAGVLDGSGSPCTNGVAVATWQDQSGNGYDATQATSGQRPFYAAGAINGLPSIGYNAASGQSLISTTTRGSAETIFCLSRLDTAAGNHSVYDGASVNTRRLFAAPGSGFAHLSAYSSGNVIQNSAVSAGTWTLSALTYNGSSSILRCNGTDATGTQSPSGDGFTVGNEGALGSPFSGLIAEILVYLRVLSSIVRASVESYLTTKYALAPYVFRPGRTRKWFIVTTGGGTVGALSGSIALNFGRNAAITGKGKLAGSDPFSLGASGTSRATGRLGGTLPHTSTNSGAVRGGGKLTGTSGVNFGSAAAAKGSGKLAGSVTQHFGGSGFLTGGGQIGALAGSEAFSIAGTAAIRGVGRLAGSPSLQSTGSATVQGAGKLSATLQLRLAAVAALRAAGKLSGSSAMQLGASGFLSDPGSGPPAGASELLLLILQSYTDLN